jgi:hypothetical protein
MLRMAHPSQLMEGQAFSCAWFSENLVVNSGDRSCLWSQIRSPHRTLSPLEALATLGG